MSHEQLIEKPIVAFVFMFLLLLTWNGSIFKTNFDFILEM